MIIEALVEMWTALRNRQFAKQQPKPEDMGVGDQLLSLQSGNKNVAIGRDAIASGEPFFLALGDIDAPFGGWITSKEELDAAGLEHYYEIAPNGHRIGKTRPKVNGSTSHE